MAAVVWLESGIEDAERIFEFLAQNNPALAAARLKDIRDALNILKRAPQMGRPIAQGCRELLIGRRHSGYIALYRYEATTDTAFILHLRSQRQQPSS